MTKTELKALLNSKFWSDEAACNWLAEQGFITASPYTAYVYSQPDGDFIGTSDDHGSTVDNFIAGLCESELKDLAYALEATDPEEDY